MYFWGTLYWLIETMTTFGGLSTGTAVFAAFLLVAYLSLFPAVFSVSLALGRRRLGAWALALAVPGYLSLGIIVGSDHLLWSTHEAGLSPADSLAGVTAATLVSLPLALVLVEPYDAAGVGLLAFTAAACPFGQVLASAVLPGAGAPAPALRRIDTLLVLAPIWAAAAGAI